jgi:hypothetical protein
MIRKSVPRFSEKIMLNPMVPEPGKAPQKRPNKFLG